MKKLVLAGVVLAVLYLGFGRNGILRDFVETWATEIAAELKGAPETAFDELPSGSQVHGEGKVSKLLPDDTQGRRHQRFIITMASGHTLLIAHNIDLAPRIPSLRIGDTVEFYGVYEQNDKGGVIHWTHHDPDRRHEAGWLRHGGRTYQ